MKNGQSLLPMVNLIEQSQKAVDDLIDGMERALAWGIERCSWKARARFEVRAASAYLRRNLELLNDIVWQSL